jgi:hypothetical protein
MSVIGATADDICRLRVFRLLTAHTGYWLYRAIRLPRFDFDGRFAMGAQVVCGAKMNRDKLIGNHWLVSVETPKQLRLLSFGAPRPARETKAFPTEIEAKQFAIAMLSEGRKVTAGTLSPHQPIRRTITASEINRWIREEEQRARQNPGPKNVADRGSGFQQFGTACRTRRPCASAPAHPDLQSETHSVQNTQNGLEVWMPFARKSSINAHSCNSRFFCNV